jgi:hypothetical protein
MYKKTVRSGMVEIEDRVNIEIEIYRIKIILKISKIRYKMMKIE